MAGSDALSIDLGEPVRVVTEVLLRGDNVKEGMRAEAIAEVANNYPDTYFAGIDIWLDPEKAPKNALGLLFKEQESGYLAGVVAGLLTKEYASASPKLNDKNVVGAVLGMDIPPVERFQAGYYAGVKSVNPDCEVLTVVSGSFNDQAKGKEATLALIEQGADIVFQIAGLTGVGVINAAKEKGILAISIQILLRFMNGQEKSKEKRGQ